MDLEKTLLRKVGEAIHRFRMIEDGERVAVFDHAETVYRFADFAQQGFFEVHQTRLADQVFFQVLQTRVNHLFHPKHFRRSTSERSSMRRLVSEKR